MQKGVKYLNFNLRIFMLITFISFRIRYLELLVELRKDAYYCATMNNIVVNNNINIIIYL